MCNIYRPALFRPSLIILLLLFPPARLARRYEGYIKDREVVFKEAHKVKKVYLKKMKELKEAAMASEDFGIVHIATREVADTRNRIKERLYRTYWS